jgi:hypothetical protein
MYRKPVLFCTILIAILLAGGLLFTPANAQQEGFKETFDDPSLPGWERSPETLVIDGVLRISPGNFALRFGDWSDITLNLRVRYSNPGETFVNYYFRDEGKYAVVLTEGVVILEKEENRTPTGLGTAETALVQPNTWMNLRVVVSGGEHQVYLNDELLITATDPAPLPPGAFLFQVMGEATVEFDDLEVTGTSGEFPPGEHEEPTPVGEPAGEPAEGGEPQLFGEPGSQVPGEPVDDTRGLVEEFFVSQANNLELATFLINLILAAVCSYILSRVYIHWGSSLTNRRRFAANFMLMTLTTTFIILVVRSSVALSLGLVGALSIVRFRTAIKEPEELAYLFFAIGLGIGLGDNQRLITLVALAAGIIIIGLTRLFRKTGADVNLHLTVSSHNPVKVSLEQIMDLLERHCSKLKLLRYDENQATLEMAFMVEFKRVSDLNQAKTAIQALSDTVEITFLDNKGIW